MKKIPVISIVLLFLFYAITYADIIYLKDGGKVRGSIIYEDEEKIKIKIAIGVMTIERSSIDKIETDKPQIKAELVKPEVELKTVSPLKEELESLRASLPEEVDQARAPLDEEIDSLKEERRSLLQRQRELDKELLSSQDEITSLKKTLTKIEKGHEEKTLSLEKLSSTTKEKDSIIKKITKERDSLAKDLASIQSEEAYLQKQLASLEEGARELRASLPEEVDQARAPLEEEIDSLKEERRSLLQRQRELDKEVLSSQDEITSLKNALTETKNHMFEVEQELQEKTFSLEKLSFPTNITQTKRPDFKDLLDLKLPEQTAELADKINSFYYSFIDKDVSVIKATISDSHMEELIEKIENQYIGWDVNIADKMRKIKITATYRPSLNMLTFNVSDKPEFETEELNEIIEEIFIHSSIKIYKELLDEEMACLIPLIDPRCDKVQSINVIGGDLILELLDQTGKMYWTFDEEYKLKSIEKLDAKGSANVRQTYEFEIFESKYLIKNFAERISGSYSKREMEYQVVNGVKIPNRFLVSAIGNDLNKTNLELYFNDIEVVVND